MKKKRNTYHIIYKFKEEDDTVYGLSFIGTEEELSKKVADEGFSFYKIRSINGVVTPDGLKYWNLRSWKQLPEIA